MPLRAFPVLDAKDVLAYERLGFVEQARLSGRDGEVGFVRLRRDAAELSVTT